MFADGVVVRERHGATHQVPFQRHAKRRAVLVHVVVVVVVVVVRVARVPVSIQRQENVAEPAIFPDVLQHLLEVHPLKE